MVDVLSSSFRWLQAKHFAKPESVIVHASTGLDHPELNQTKSRVLNNIIKDELLRIDGPGQLRYRDIMKMLMLL